MEIIYLSHPYNPDKIPDESVVMTLGFFDGVHLGHQKVIERAREEANKRGLKLALMTFNQHPRIVYEDLNLDSFNYLTTNKRKAELMEQFNVDILYIVDYTFSFGTQTPQEFVEEYLVSLNTEVAVAGYDYTYGKKEIANMHTLPIHASDRFDVIEVDELSSHHMKISTTRIKELIYNGEVTQANNDLGYIYEVYGTVIHGEKVGRTLGYPTANIQVAHPQLLPGIGVYAVEIKIGDTWHLGSASIGHNITFYDNHDLTCEVYILDFNKMIYGEKVRVRWHHYLRGEYKFDNIDGLIDQLKIDEENTRIYFKQLNGDANV
ncbi:riboflavin biosynthesis protein RibF [Aerococcaceae bacterium DSM 111021]|nr:riboflavin biosynthesis protein RibF [Aerococcaceae bacterium DSM 111021]